jgi:acyl carrier protein
MTSLTQELKELVIDTLNLEDITPDDIDSKSPLFVEGLGLDSIDALELGVIIKKKYNITIDAEDSATKEHFSSINNLAAFINSERGK